MMYFMASDFVDASKIRKVSIYTVLSKKKSLTCSVDFNINILQKKCVFS